VPAGRLARVFAELSAEGDGDWSSSRLCEAAREIIGVSGTGVMLMSDEIPRGSLCATNAVSGLIEELQFTLGEGPCVDAHRHDQVVLAPDLTAADATRWPAFTPPAVEAGVQAVFAFPLQVGTVRLGALDLYRDSRGALTDDQHADALVMAGVIAHWVLDVQADTPPGSIAVALEEHADLHFVVHNAAGAVSVQLGISVTEALIRLRAYAFGNDRLLRDVAEDVVARRLRF
jgi:hypothetical protein